MKHAAFSLALTFLLLPAAAQSSWPAFRGADAMGVSDHPGLPDKWSSSENVLWKRDLPGRGWSSPITSGDRVFLTTVVNAGETESVKRGLYFGGERRAAPESEHRWVVTCLDLNTGEPLWQAEAHKGRPAHGHHIKSSYASETPVTDGERVYAYFGNLGVFCFSVEGKPLWSHPLTAHKTRYSWGTAASPVLHDGRLYIVNDNEDDSYLLALDAKTGKQLWRTERAEKSNWSTPYVWKNDLRTEIITPGSGKSRAYDLEGKLLYEWDGCSSITIATPYSKFGLLYVSSGYVGDRRKPIFALRPGASGDISFKADETSNDHIAWCQKRAAPYNPTTIVYGDLLYVLHDRGVMTCFDAKTGEEVYGRQRIKGGRSFTTSPWASNGKIFCLNEYGETFVIKAGRQFELLHTNSLEEDELCMATPAMAGDKLLIRTEERIYCMGSKQR